MGFAALAALTLLAFAAAAGVAVRLAYGSRAERMLATFLCWNLTVLLPIHALGLTHALTARNLAAASAAFSLCVLVASSARTPRGAHLCAVGATLRDLALLPRDALAECLRRRSLVLAGPVLVLGLLGWTAWLTWLAPHASWDGIWYHDTGVGYAIQEHGYGYWSMQSTFVQQANGYPRNCEMTNLWFVIFTDRRLLELPNSIVAVPFVLATYVLARRFSSDRVAAIGWACAILLMPGSALELRSTYVDLHVAVFHLAAMHFVTRPGMRIRDGWMAALTLALLVGSKGTALVWTPVLALLAVAWLAAHTRHRARAFALTVAGSVVVICAMASLTYLRNWLHWHNPVWPVTVRIDKLHIHWPGLGDMGALDRDRPLKVILSEIAAVPTPGHDFADSRQFGYGLAVPFLLLPLAGLGLASALVAFGRDAARRLLRATPTPDLPKVTALLVLALYTFFCMKASPELREARYNLHLPVGLMLLVAWLDGRRPAAGLGASAAAASIVLFGINLWWADPPVGEIGWDEAKAYAAMSPEARATTPPRKNGWTLPHATMVARERELGPGAVVAYGEGTTFPSVLWNERYSNRLVYVPDGPPATVLARLDELGARWAVDRAPGGVFAAAQSRPDLWEPIGLASAGYPTTAFRRKPAAAPAAR